MTVNWDGSAALGDVTTQKQTAGPAGVPSKRSKPEKLKQFMQKNEPGAVDVHTHTHFRLQ